MPRNTCAALVNVLLTDDLDPVAHGVEEVEKRSGYRLDPRVRQYRTNELLVIDQRRGRYDCKTDRFYLGCNRCNHLIF